MEIRRKTFFYALLITISVLLVAGISIYFFSKHKKENARIALVLEKTFPNVNMLMRNFGSINSGQTDIHQIQTTSMMDRSDIKAYAQDLYKGKGAEAGNIRYFFCLNTLFSYCILKPFTDKNTVYEEYNKTLFKKEIKIIPKPKNTMNIYVDNSNEYLLLVLKSNSDECYFYLALNFANDDFRLKLKNSSQITIDELGALTLLATVMSSMINF